MTRPAGDRYAALAVLGPAGANYNSIFCDAPMWDAIQQMDVWSPTCFSDGRDRFKYLSLAVTLVFVSLPRRRQGNLRFPLTYTYHGGHGSDKAMLCYWP